MVSPDGVDDPKQVSGQWMVFDDGEGNPVSACVVDRYVDVHTPIGTVGACSGDFVVMSGSKMRVIQRKLWTLKPIECDKSEPEPEVEMKPEPKPERVVETYDHLTRTQLIDLCRHRGLIVAGNRSHLIKRLEDDDMGMVADA